jgi:hypothetical protein
LSPENPRAALAREALRLHQRYQRELIERFSVCPWATPARAADRIRAHVVIDAMPDMETLASIVRRWADDEHAQVAFVIVPRFDRGIDAFEKWAADVGALQQEVFLSAPFHPDVSPTAGTIHFLRQTPDPTVQLVRRVRLEEIRSQDPPHYTDIFDLDVRDLETGKGPKTVAASVLAHNDRMLEREGRARLQAILDDIRADREQTYAALLPSL